jgi:hypothetical protein
MAMTNLNHSTHSGEFGFLIGSDRLKGAGREIDNDLVRELFDGHLHLLGRDVFGDVNPRCGSRPGDRYKVGC